MSGIIPVVLSDTPFRTAYGPKERVQLDTGEESNVKQSFKDEVDVNNIVVRFRSTGVLPSSSDARTPVFVDVSDMPSYQEALNHVQAVSEFFASLPAATRADFGNDPAFFMDWVSDPANYEEAKSYGVEPAPVASGDSGVVASGGSQEASAPIAAP